MLKFVLLQQCGKLPNLQADPDLIMDTFFWNAARPYERAHTVKVQFGSGSNWDPPRSYDMLGDLKHWFE